MEGFLARHVEGSASNLQVAESRRKELDDLLIGTDLARRVEGFRIWRNDGMVIYSTDKSLIGKAFPSADIKRAFTGRVVAQLETGHNDGEGEEEPTTDRPLIEIYAPIYRSGTREIIAVGELYEDAAEFLVQRGRVQRQTWAIVGATTLAIMALLFLIVRRASNIIANQRMTLKAQLTEAQALADQNTELRKVADRARMDATKSNEQLLNRIGADLHDGPVQLLSLLILKLGRPSDAPVPARTTFDSAADVTEADLAPSHIASQVLAELRELSTGLVMPEIENMPLEAALRMAVDQHEYATGSKVTVAYDRLPERVAHPLKICLYRVVQEGLNNAFRHGGGRDQRVSASADQQAITVVIADDGPGLGVNNSQARHRPLGLQGIRNRVEAFGGSVDIRRGPRSGTELQVVVPMEGNGI
jgi:signal transduction histidine kinase